HGNLQVQVRKSEALLPRDLPIEGDRDGQAGQVAQAHDLRDDLAQLVDEGSGRLVRAHRRKRAGENGSQPAAVWPVMLMPATSSPVAGPRVMPSIECPVATKTLGAARSRPITGSPSGASGRMPTHSSTRGSASGSRK